MKKPIRIAKLGCVSGSKERWGELHNQLLAEIASDDVIVDTIHIHDIPIKHISSSYDAHIVTQAQVREAIKAENEGYHAVVINCLLEPGLSAAREACQIPVVGDTGAALHLASLVARKFSFLLPGIEYPGQTRHFADVISLYGFEKHIASLRGVRMHVTNFSGDKNAEPVEEMLKEAWIAIREDGAQAIIGYGGPAIYKTLRAELPVPVISPIQASVIMAETLVRANLSQSKIAYPNPENLSSICC